jgi:hypothetical protein
VNLEIRSRTRDHVAQHLSAGPGSIERRLDELEAEWDIERTLEANAAVLALIGIGLGTFVSRKWLILPAFVSAFLLQHAIQGWCPPVPVFRRLGFRTPREIETERSALKVLRGDYKDASVIVSEGRPNPDRIMEAVER